MISRDQLRSNYALAKLRLDRAKEEEIRWRMLVVLEFTPETPKLGRNWSDDGTVAIIIKENITLEKNIDKVKGLINTVQNQFQYNLSAVFGWQYTVSDAAYRLLPSDIQTALAPVLIIKAGTPSVELKGNNK